MTKPHFGHEEVNEGGSVQRAAKKISLADECGQFLRRPFPACSVRPHLSLLMAPLRRFEWLLFSACFIAFSWFHQGGGWNQNARFAEVRAIVEEGRFAIDDFLVYKVDPDDPTGRRFVRLPVRNAEYRWEGELRALSWVDMAYELYPVNEDSRTPDAKNMPMIEECNSGDIGYVPWTGQFHPNKPPGTTFLAVPAYWLIYHFEKWRGLNPDDWWTLTVNAWLTSVFSVGLVSAFGCVVFFRLAREMAGGKSLPALLATLSLAFGTTFFPFATLMFDHNLTAIFLLMAFSCLWRVRGHGARAGRSGCCWREPVRRHRGDHELHRRGSGSARVLICLARNAAAGREATLELARGHLVFRRRGAALSDHLRLRLGELRFAFQAGQ